MQVVRVVCFRAAARLAHPPVPGVTQAPPNAIRRSGSRYGHRFHEDSVICPARLRPAQTFARSLRTPEAAPVIRPPGGSCFLRNTSVAVAARRPSVGILRRYYLRPSNSFEDDGWRSTSSRSTMAAVTPRTLGERGALDDDHEGPQPSGRAGRPARGSAYLAMAMRSVRRRPADPSSRAMACEEGLDQALAVAGRRLVERDLVAVDFQGDPGVGMAADPSPQGREQRPE